MRKRSNPQSLPISKPHYVLYNDCSELPLFNWVKLVCSGDLKWIVSEGRCEDAKELQEQYTKLVAEYSTLIRDTRTTQELKLKIQVTQLANKIDQVNVAMHALRTGGRDLEIIRILRTPVPNGLGFGRLSYVNLEHDLKLTESYLKMDEVRYKQRSLEIETLLKKAEANGGNSESDFYSEISSLSKWLGFGIAPRETTVIQYVSFLNQLKLEIKNSERK